MNPDSLSESKKQLEANLEDGMNCPLCGQFCKLYKRKLNSGMAAGLVWLVKEYEETNDWVNIPTRAPRFILRTGGQFSLLGHWNLIIQKQNEEESTRCSGLWMPTRLGIDFVRQQADVPSHVFLYNNEVLGFSNERIGIIQALRSHFNYNELMSGVPDDGSATNP